MHKLLQAGVEDAWAAVIVLLVCLQMSQGLQDLDHELHDIQTQNMDPNTHTVGKSNDYTGVSNPNTLKKKDEIHIQETLNPLNALVHKVEDEIQQKTKGNSSLSHIISENREGLSLKNTSLNISSLGTIIHKETLQQFHGRSYKPDLPITQSQPEKRSLRRFIPQINQIKSKYKEPKILDKGFISSVNEITPIKEVKPAQSVNKIKSLKQMKSLTEIQSKSYQKQKYYKKILTKVLRNPRESKKMFAQGKSSNDIYFTKRPLYSSDAKTIPLKKVIEVKNKINENNSSKIPKTLQLQQNKYMNAQEQKTNTKLIEMIKEMPLNKSNDVINSKDLLTEQQFQKSGNKSQVLEPNMINYLKGKISVESEVSNTDIQKDANYQADLPVSDKLVNTMPKPTEFLLTVTNTPHNDTTISYPQSLSKLDTIGNKLTTYPPLSDQLQPNDPTKNIISKPNDVIYKPEHQPSNEPDGNYISADKAYSPSYYSPKNRRQIPPLKDQLQPNNQIKNTISKRNDVINEPEHQIYPAPDSNYIPAYHRYYPSYYPPQNSMQYPYYYDYHNSGRHYYHHYSMWTCQFYPYCCWNLLAPMYYQSYCCCVVAWMCPYYDYKQPSREERSALTTVSPRKAPPPDPTPAPPTAPHIRVNITVFITAKCPFALSFLRDDAEPMMEVLSDHVNLQMIPHGKVSNEEEVTCKFEMVDCLANKYILCVMQQISDQKKQLEYALCLMDLIQVLTSITVHNLAAKCSDGHGMKWGSVEQCIIGSEGEQLLRDTDLKKRDFMGDEHLYTPTVYVEQEELWDYRKVKLAVCLSLKLRGENNHYC